MKDSKVFFITVIVIAVAIFISLKPRQQTVIQPLILTAEENFSEVSLKIPAVDNEGNGVSTLLTVGIKPGSGRALVDINQLLFWVDTQYSIQVAKKVAEKITNANLSRVDLLYRIETNASVIEGPSAGAALTVATVALVEGRKVNESVVITGTINPDGTIGPVGGIIPKAKAAKEGGATLFLVPSGQSVQSTYKPIQTCEKIAGWTVCRTEYKREATRVSDVDIDVREVSSIEEALKYFLI